MDRRNDPSAYQNKAPIADLHKSKDIFDKCLSTPVTLTIGELCGVSVKIQNHFRESTSPKQLVNVNNAEIAITAQSKIQSKIESKIDTETGNHFGDTFETDYFLHLGQPTINNPYELYHQSLTNDHISEDVQVAKEADAIRTIKANLNNFGEVDCIVDSGSQVVAISKAMAVKFGLTWDPRITLKMVSANGQSDNTLGLARNVPFTVGHITFFLQFHVIQNPSYDVLLGRPFDVLTKSEVKTRNKAQTIITISDPNTGEVLTVPTFPRDCPKPRIQGQDFRTSRM
ncbi:hypothetical protein C0991_011203 [Blastosporella zonata]|nr:hypothetical protein C0991_011203 [Blastosporella zonata]